jgi:hypothetical protein
MLIPIFVAENSPNLKFVREAANIANFAQSHFYYEIRMRPGDFFDLLINNKQQLSYRKAINLVTSKSPEHSIYVVDWRFDNNYFSYTGAEIAIITTADWSQKFAPPSLTAFPAREIVMSAICFCAEVTDDDIQRISRRPSIGCLFDFCGEKTDIRFGLVAGYISLETKAGLSRHGVEPKVLTAAEQILEFVRLDAIGRHAPSDYTEAFIVMKFSERDENANAYEHGIRPALAEFGLEAKRADEDPRMQILSQKVLEHIEKCRLVIIKVDESNVNVFFELGYAIAKRKDILVICRDSQLGSVPSDIKGWELLTYPDGDFAALKAKVTAYLDNILPHRRHSASIQPVQIRS